MLTALRIEKDGEEFNGIATQDGHESYVYSGYSISEVAQELIALAIASNIPSVTIKVETFK